MEMTNMQKESDEAPDTKVEEKDDEKGEIPKPVAQPKNSGGLCACFSSTPAVNQFFKCLFFVQNFHNEVSSVITQFII